MNKISKKALGTVMAGVMTVGAVAGAVNGIEDIKIVNAAESKALKDAKAKISHLTWSLKNNYLGIKNQGTWELYVKQARDLIDKISSSEKKQADALTDEVNRDSAMIQGLARINKVEKSIETNYNGIKNSRQWREYLELAEIDLAKVNKVEFKKQYAELVERKSVCTKIVDKIEADFKIEYNAAVVKYYDALKSRNLTQAKEALEVAKTLGTCDESDRLEEDCQTLIDDITGVSKANVLSADAINSKELVVRFSKEVDESKVASSVKLTGKDGEVTFTLNQKSVDGKTFTLTSNKAINIENGTIIIEPIATKEDANKLTDKYVAVFNYKDIVAPKIVNVEGKDGKALITFNEEIAQGTTVSVNAQNHSNISISGKVLTINGLQNENTYSLQIVGAKDLSGNIANPINTTVTVKKTGEALKQEVAVKVSENKLTLEFVNPLSASNVAGIIFTNGKKYSSTALSLNGEATKESGIIYSEDKKTVSIDTQKIGVLGTLNFLNTDIVVSGAGLEKDYIKSVQLSSDKTAPKLVNSETNAGGDLTLTYNEEVVLPKDKKISLKVTHIDGIYQSKAIQWSNVNVDYAKDKGGNDIINKLVIKLENNLEVNKNYTVEIPAGINDIYTNATEAIAISVIKPKSDTSVTPDAKITVDANVNKNIINLKFSNIATNKGLTDTAKDPLNYKLGGYDLPVGTQVRFIDNRFNVQIILPEDSIITNGSYVLSIKNIKDEIGNTLKSGQERKVVELVENVAPRVESLTIASSETAIVTFSESVISEDRDKNVVISGVAVDVNGKTKSDVTLKLSDDEKSLTVDGLSLQTGDVLTVKFIGAEIFDKSENKNQLKDFIIIK